jgi:hypothetical protein
MIDIDWHPDRRKLRQFAAASLLGFPMLGWLVARWVPSVLPLFPVVAVAVAAGLVVGVTGLVHPPAVRPVYIALLALTWPLGLVLGVTVMAVIYFGVFTPAAVILRLTGTDPMQRPFTSGRTYWTRRRPPPPAATYFRQY